MHVMDEAEYYRFLTEGTRTGKLATVRSDGRPHVAPVWFDLDDDGTVVLTTGADSVKGKNLRRDPRVWIAGRYMGAERAEQYGRGNAMPGELLVQITPNHVVAQAEIGD